MVSSPQVAGVPRFRFGPPEDMPQTSSSHSDLGQLASQGGKHLKKSLALLGLHVFGNKLFWCDFLYKWANIFKSWYLNNSYVNL